MDILLTCATAVEGKPLRQLLSSDSSAQQRNGVWVWEKRRNRIGMVRTGISTERAKRTLQNIRWSSSPAKPAPQREAPAGVLAGEVAKRETINPKLKPEAVVVFGIAGQLDAGFPVGTIAIPNLWRNELRAPPLPCSERLLQTASHTPAHAFSGSGMEVHVGGAGVTLQQPALSRAERDSVRQRYPDAVICDMETFVVMEQFPGAECLSVRIISDDGTEPLLQRKPMKHPMCALHDVSDHCARLAEFVYRFLQELES